MSQVQTTHRPAPVAPDAEGNYAGYHVGFWRRPWVRSVLPWATSLGIHLGVVVLAVVLLASPLGQTLIPKFTLAQVNVPTTELAATSIGGVPNVGNMDDVTSANAQLDPVRQSDNPLPQGEGDAATALNAAAGSGSGGEAAGGGLTGITGAGSLADALGGGAGGGGGQGSTLFGEPGGGGKFMGFDVGVNGDGGRVYKIAFVSDGSGSMQGRTRIFVSNELKKAVDPLNPVQFFNVLFFLSDSYEAVFPKLMPATPKNLRVAYDGMERVVFRGTTDPIPALRAAFDMKPELVFFLTDGEFDKQVSYGDVIGEIRRLNADKKVMINTVQLVKEKEDPKAASTLRTIANENGGKYRAVQTTN